MATRTLLRHDAIIDKLVGDEVMAFFVRGISGPDYRKRAVEAGLDLMRAWATAQPSPLDRIGRRRQRGLAYIGNVGAAVMDFTALGDTVNVAARMQQHAAGGELLVAQGVADDLVGNAALRTLDLRGRQEPLDAFLVGPQRVELNS